MKEASVESLRRTGIARVDAGELVKENALVDLMTHPNQGRIEPNWGAESEGASFRIGPRVNGFRRCNDPYIAKTVLCIQAREQLEDLARESGLKVVPDGEVDLDGVCERHYKFVEL